jgi:hypothetical protein
MSSGAAEGKGTFPREKDVWFNNTDGVNKNIDAID